MLVEAIAAGERGAYWALLSDMMDRQNNHEQNNNSFPIMENHDERGGSLSASL
jgi:hypothetical protein